LFFAGWIVGIITTRIASDRSSGGRLVLAQLAGPRPESDPSAIRSPLPHRANTTDTIKADLLAAIGELDWRRRERAIAGALSVAQIDDIQGLS